jgi:tetratricopeptide (TPR) repeat protein
MNYNTLALAYYSGNQYSNALETALRGLVIDSSLSILNRTAGINCFFLKDYQSAIKYFDRAYKTNPNDFVLQDFKIQTMLLQNTNPEKFSFPTGGVITLVGISSESIKKTEDLISGSNADYSYKKLLSKLSLTPYSMSLNEFFLLYYGVSMDDSYSPYNTTASGKKPEADLNKKASLLEEQIFKSPTDFPLYLSLADVYLEMGNNEKYFENRFKYFGFTESIKAAGDGLSPETAYIVTDFNHEYNILVSLGYKIKAQARIKQKKQNFDVISVSDENDNEVLVYFNIDKPYGKLPKKVKK